MVDKSKDLSFGFSDDLGFLVCDCLIAACFKLEQQSLLAIQLCSMSLDVIHGGLERSQPLDVIRCSPDRLPKRRELFVEKLFLQRIAREWAVVGFDIIPLSQSLFFIVIPPYSSRKS
jgi:hypothetical protein